MSREIKFRAWDGEQYWYNVMPSPIPSPTLDVCKEITNFEPEYDNAVDIIRGAEVIEQYTGLKDKNVREIYEGDIIKGSETLSKEKRFCNWKIYWCTQAGAWRASAPAHCSEMALYKIFDIEVIGNIHENPELLNLRNSTELEGKVVGYALVNQDTGEVVAKVGEINVEGKR